MSSGKERLDVLVQRRAGVSRSKAQGLIQTGQVRDATGEPLTKPGFRLPDDADFVIMEETRFVSRGGGKLDAAVEAWHLDLKDIVAIDVGASTGGFTDCMLQHGAARVYAIDVGYGQLAWKLRQDPRVVVFERTNIRHLDPDAIDEQPAFFTVDCSFISLRLVLPALAPVLAPNAHGVVLIKPQFEAGKDTVPRGGVVRDEAVHRQVVDAFLEDARAHGFICRDVMPSPLLGSAGNREFLAHLVRETAAAP